MNDAASVISECDNLEIENYLKSCGCFQKNTGVKKFNCLGSQSSRDVGGLIQYSKCMLNKWRNDLRDDQATDIDRHILIEKERLNELLKSRIKEYLQDNPMKDRSSVEELQQPEKIVHFKGPKPKPLVRNVRLINTFDRHSHCMGNKKNAKPVLISRKSQQMNENRAKSLRICRNIVVDPTPVTSYYPRRIYNNTTRESQASFRPTWHDRLMMGLDSATSSKCTVVTTTTTSQVIKKSEIKVLRYNFDWGGGTDAAPNKTTDDKIVNNIDQTTQTDINVVTTKSVECFTDQVCEINTALAIREQSPENNIEPIVVHVSSHETDENAQVTVGSSFEYEYELTFDESDSDSESDSKLSATIRSALEPAPKLSVLEPAPKLSVLLPRKPNILMETVVYEDKKSDQRDAEIQTDFEAVRKSVSPKRNHFHEPQKDVELELSRLDEEILQDKFKLLSILRHTPSQDMRHQSINTQHSEIQLQLTPLKPRQATEFMPSPLELSSIRPLSLAHKNTTFDISNEKYWKTINKIQMDATRNPFSPKSEVNDVAKRAAEKFLKSTNAHQTNEPEHNSTSSSSNSNNVMIIVTSSSEYESDSTSTSHRYAAQLRHLSYSGKISEGEVLSLGEVG